MVSEIVGACLLLSVATANVERTSCEAVGQREASENDRADYAQNDDNGSDVVVPPYNRNGNVPRNQQSWPPPNPYPQNNNFPPPQQPQIGNVCYTVYGGFFGPPNPVGMPCSATLPNGIVVPGTVGVAGVLPRVIPAPPMR